MPLSRIHVNKTRRSVGQIEKLWKWKLCWIIRYTSSSKEFRFRATRTIWDQIYSFRSEALRGRNWELWWMKSVEISWEERTRRDLQLSWRLERQTRRSWGSKNGSWDLDLRFRENEEKKGKAAALETLYRPRVGGKDGHRNCWRVETNHTKNGVVFRKLELKSWC